MKLTWQDCSIGLSTASSEQVMAIVQSEKGFPPLVLLGCSQVSAHGYNIANSRNPLEQSCRHMGG